MSLMPAGLFDWLSAVSVAIATGLVSHLAKLNTRFHVMEALNKKMEKSVADLEAEQLLQKTELALSKEKITQLNVKVDVIGTQLSGISEKTQILPAIKQAMDTLQDEFRWLRDIREGKK